MSDRDIESNQRKAKMKFPMDGHPYFRPPYEKEPDEWWWEPYKTMFLVFGALLAMLAAAWLC